MVAVPAWVWRFGSIPRALIVGPVVGIVIGLLAFLGSGSVLAGLVALVIVTPLYGALMARQMTKYWPEANKLAGTDRVAVTRAVRSGREIGDARLAPAVIAYSRALHAASERSRLWWWLIVVLGVVAIGFAIVDTVTAAPVGEAVVSWLYFAFFPIEAWWWPRRQARLLANARRAEQLG
jgi:multidrug efflux pump subunit AcrB